MESSTVVVGIFDDRYQAEQYAHRGVVSRMKKSLGENKAVVMISSVDDLVMI